MNTLLLRCICVLIALLSGRSAATMADDTTLFVLQLSADSSSIRFCNRNTAIRDMLSGPTLMAGNSLLFRSSSAYLLVDTTGTVLDSHTVHEEAPPRKLPEAGPLSIVCVLDSTTLLYARHSGVKEQPVLFYTRNLHKKKLRELKPEQAAPYAGLLGGALLNIARNDLRDEMASRVLLTPQLIGFTGVDAPGSRWWSLDRFYNFSSPVIHERNGEFLSFFPGISAARRSLRDRSLDVSGVYTFDGRDYYAGVWAPMGNEHWRSWQTLYFCDQAGNVMFRDSLLKKTDTEVIIGRDDSAPRPTLYYARATQSFVFPPVVDHSGTVYYGTVDYDERTLTVQRRRYATFRATQGEAALAHLIDLEKDIAYEPIDIPCASPQQIGAMIPMVRFTTAKGERRTADVRDLTRDGHIVRITRQVYRDVESKLARGRGGLPAPIEAIRDSLSRLSTAGCPYSISLSGPRGVIRTFDYGAGETVLCARVIAVRTSGEIVVRVDLESYAEVLVFMPDGTLFGRFIFNRQNVTERHDIVVALGGSPIIELDFESDPEKGRFIHWAPTLPR